MSNHMTQKEKDCLSALILFHTQKVSDYTRAVPNVGMARRHNEWVEILRKSQSLMIGSTLTCNGCVRETMEHSDYTCMNCARNVEFPDNFKRRKNGAGESPAPTGAGSTLPAGSAAQAANQTEAHPHRSADAQRRLNARDDRAGSQP